MAPKRIQILTVGDIVTPSSSAHSKNLAATSIEVAYSITYTNSSVASSAGAISAALAGVNFTSVFKANLIAALGNDPTLIALANILVVSDISSISSGVSASPTTAPTANGNYGASSPSRVASLSAATIVIICFSIFIGICLLVVAFILCASRRASKPELEDIFPDDPREAGLGGHATDPGKRDTYFQIQASTVLKRQEKDDIFLL